MKEAKKAPWWNVKVYRDKKQIWASSVRAGNARVAINRVLSQWAFYAPYTVTVERDALDVRKVVANPRDYLPK